MEPWACKDTVMAILQGISIAVLAWTLWYVKKYVEATNSLVKETNEQASATKDLVKFSWEDFRPYVQIMFLNNDKENRIHKYGVHVENESSCFIINMLNFTKSVVNFSIIPDAIYLSDNEDNFKVKFGDIYGIINNESFTLYPQESMTCMAIVKYTNVDICQIIKGYDNEKRKLFLLIYFNVKYNNDYIYEQIEETWMYEIKCILYSEGAESCVLNGIWHGPRRIPKGKE